MFVGVKNLELVCFLVSAENCAGVNIMTNTTYANIQFYQFHFHFPSDRKVIKKSVKCFSFRLPIGKEIHVVVIVEQI